MRQQISSEVLSRDITPLCPRDNHEMSYEQHGIRWAEELKSGTQQVSSYHCGYFGCSVRYDLHEGYFTVIDAPELPHFVEEPGVNLLRCPKHGAWLYRSNEQDSRGKLSWRCGVDGCDYTHADVGTPASSDLI
jgi:hypothetical protein